MALNKFIYKTIIPPWRCSDVLQVQMAQEARYQAVIVFNEPGSEDIFRMADRDGGRDF